MPNAHRNETYHTDCFDYAGADLNTKQVIEPGQAGSSRNFNEVGIYR